jgi:hypothetical protein
MNASQKTHFTNAKRHLAAGILAQARRDLRRFHGATRAVERELYRDAHDWVVSDSCRWPFSFRNVCELLNLMPENVRQEVFRDVSASAFHYWSRRCGVAFRKTHLSLRHVVASVRSRSDAEISALAHGLS